MSKHTILSLALTLGLLGVASFAGAQITAFTYQGRLADNGSRANGNYDLRFTIYDSRESGNVVAGPPVTNALAISNGLFTVTLDFGSGVFAGPEAPECKTT